MCKKAPISLPPVINWHLEARCNYGCKFCFATFEDVKQHQAEKPKHSPHATVTTAAQQATSSTNPKSISAQHPDHPVLDLESSRGQSQVLLSSKPMQEQQQEERLLQVPQMLADAGASKITFVGK